MDKLNATKNTLLFLLQAPTHHSSTFNLWFLYELKHTVLLSKLCVGSSIFGSVSFLLKFVFLFNKKHRLIYFKKRHTGIPGLSTQELDAGLWAFVSGRWTLDAGFWTLSSGRWTLNSGRWTMGTGLWTLDTGLCTLDYGHWTLNAGLWNIGPEPWTLDSGHWMLDCGR